MECMVKGEAKGMLSGERVKTNKKMWMLAKGDEREVGKCEKKYYWIKNALTELQRKPEI